MKALLRLSETNPDGTEGSIELSLTIDDDQALKVLDLLDGWTETTAERVALKIAADAIYNNTHP